MLRGGLGAKCKNKLTSLIVVMSAFVLFIPFSGYIAKVSAANIVTRSVTIGSSVPAELTYHEFDFVTLTNASIGSLVFEYCSNLPFYGAPCTAPAGLDVDSSTLFSQSGITGFSISASETNVNKIVLTRAPSVAAPTSASYRFNNITNQNTNNQSVYVRISTHSSVDGSGAQIDEGAVVYATVDGVGVGGYVPPRLTFCVGLTVALNCSTTNGSLLNMGELSELSASTATSQFAGSTNDPSGYNVYISGGTMTAGNEIIPALTTNSSSVVGSSQFGVNLVSNSNPVVGANVSGTGSGVPVANYNSINSFRYNDGELIASSTLPTNYNRFTVAYMVNVSENQRPGIYASSFTFTAIATF
jgi:hypothetical protein